MSETTTRHGDRLSDGTPDAMCPACAKPDPVTVGLCRDLERSVRR